MDDVVVVVDVETGVSSGYSFIINRPLLQSSSGLHSFPALVHSFTVIDGAHGNRLSSISLGFDRGLVVGNDGSEHVPSAMGVLSVGSDYATTGLDGVGSRFTISLAPVLLAVLLATVKGISFVHLDTSFGLGSHPVVLVGKGALASLAILTIVAYALLFDPVLENPNRLRTDLDLLHTKLGLHHLTLVHTWHRSLVVRDELVGLCRHSLVSGVISAEWRRFELQFERLKVLVTTQGLEDGTTTVSSHFEDLLVYGLHISLLTTKLLDLLPLDLNVAGKGVKGSPFLDIGHCLFHLLLLVDVGLLRFRDHDWHILVCFGYLLRHVLLQELLKPLYRIHISTTSLSRLGSGLVVWILPLLQN